MDILSIEEMVKRENDLFASGQTDAGALMEAAGEAMAERIRANYPEVRRFTVLVGKGNNGGDGLVVARHLARWSEARVEVVLAEPEREPGRLQLPARMAHLLTGLERVAVMPWRADFPFPNSDGLVVDALLGVQARGVLRGVLAEIVEKSNDARRRNFFRTVALDLPSGLAAYAGQDAPKEPNRAVIADLTLAVGFAKDVLCREDLAGWVGRLEVVPWSNRLTPGSGRRILVPADLAGLLPRRSALSFKNDFGRAVLVAGSSGFTGAAGLCAQAAQAMGAGLLCVVTQSEAAPVVAAQAPHEAMVSGWSETYPKVVESATAIGIGPGLGDNPQTLSMLQTVLKVGCPVVIDADGLTVLAKHPAILKEAKGPVVLTPHPGEMARLIGRKFGLAEREKVARDFTDEHGVTLILKGTRTLVTARGQPLYINSTGNPGLSTGGSGDTLTGIVTALLAQGLSPLDAARLGVWLLGHAADLVLRERGCEEGLTPTMLSAHLGAALVSLRREARPSPGLLERAAAARAERTPEPGAN